MLVSEINSRARRLFGDESGTFIEDADLYAWQTSGILKIAKTLRSTKTVTTQVLTTGTYSYALTSTAVAVDKVFIGGVELAYTPPTALIGVLNAATIEAPYGNFIIYNDNIIINNAQAVTGTNMYLHISALPTLITAGAQTPGIPEEYHEMLVNFCLARAYEMSDDLSASTYYQNKFDIDLLNMRGDVKQLHEDSYAVVRFLDED